MKHQSQYTNYNVLSIIFMHCLFVGMKCEKVMQNVFENISTIGASTVSEDILTDETFSKNNSTRTRIEINNASTEVIDEFNQMTTASLFTICETDNVSSELVREFNQTTAHFDDTSCIEDISNVTSTITESQTERTVKSMISIDVMADFLETTPVLNFLSTFENSLQRQLILKQLKFCPFIELCTFSTSLRETYSGISCCNPCSCDVKNCMNSRSCCPDVVPQNFLDFNGVDKEIQNTIKSDPLASQIASNILPTCEPVSLVPDYRKMNTGYLMVSTCPLSTKHDLHKNCTQVYTKELKEFFDILPVYDRDTLFVYRNKYCAFCNGVQQISLEFWKPLFKCINFNHQHSQTGGSQHSIIIAQFSYSNCRLEYQKPIVENLNLTPCTSSISRCNITGKWKQYDAGVEAGCLIYRSEFIDRYIGTELYQNIFCFLCNGNVPTENTCFAGPLTLLTAYSFTGLLKLEPTTNDVIGNENKASLQTRCSDGLAFNPFTGECVKLLCNELSILQNGHCVSKYEYIEEDMLYIVNLRLESMDKITIGAIFDEKQVLIERMIQIFDTNTANVTFIRKSICKTHLFLKFDSRFIIIKDDIFNSRFVYGELEMRIFSPGRQRVQELADAVQNITEAFSINSASNRSLHFEVTATDVHNNGDYELINQTFESTFELNFIDPLYFHDSDNFTVVRTTESSNKNCYGDSSPKIVYLVRYTSCPKVIISRRNESLLQMTDKGIKYSNHLVGVNQHYKDENGNIFVCASTLKKLSFDKQSIQTSSSDFENMLSIVCSSLSVMSLIVSLSTFCYFNELRRSIPGKITLALISSLLFSQSMYLIGSLGNFSKFPVLCVLIGMVIHFSWLVTMFCMNVCTYHMFRTLTRIVVHIQSRSFISLVIYLTYVFIMSSIFVIMNIVIAKSESGDIGYGGKVCYITSQFRISITFGVPVAFVCITNICMFLVVVFKIKCLPSINRNVKHERNNFVIFAKLSTLTGITWVFGLLYAWTSVVVFSYLFIVLNASQGVFIMLAFVFNRRVLAMFKHALHRETDTGVTSMRTTRTSS